MLKIEHTASITKVREILRQVHDAVMADTRFRGLTVYYDVDPL